MRFFLNKQWLLFVLLSLFVLLTRFWNLDYPNQSYFDEVYHLPAVRLIANNDVRSYEWWHGPIEEVGNNINNHDWLHPPLAKLIQASFINLFGDNAFNWRFPSALFGIGVIFAVYLLSQQIFNQVYPSSKAQNLSLLAAFLTALSGLLLVQSRIMMNDVFLVFWLCCGLFFLLRWNPELIFGQLKLTNKTSNINLLLSGFFFGLALATKWSALLLLALIFSALIFIVIRKKIWKFLPLLAFSLLLMPSLIYLFSYTQMFLQGKGLSDFTQLHQQIFWYQTHRQEGHIYSSTPLQWFLNLRPIWYWTSQNANSYQVANIYALENPALHIVGIVALIYLLFVVVKKGWQSRIAKLYIVLTLTYLATWLPWIFAPRVMFYFHYLPAVPFLGLISAEFLHSHLKPFCKLSFYSLLALIFISFVLFLPHWTGVAVSKTWVQGLYFAIPSWQ